MEKETIATTIGKLMAERRKRTELFTNKKLKVTHYAQLPCKGFEVIVDNEIEASKIVNVLAIQHLFLLEQKIISDYCNAIIVSMFDEETNEWNDYYNEKADMEWDEFEETYLKEEVSSLKLNDNLK